MSAAREPRPDIILTVDPCEITEVDCTPYLTEEEKTWPVVKLQVRPAPAQKEAVIRVTVAGTATPADVAAVVQKIRAAVEEARAATGGRIPISIEAPAPSP